MSQCLSQILQDAREARLGGRRYLAVFDLDSTLFDLKGRHKSIVARFAGCEAMRKRYPTTVLLLENISFISKDWGIDTALKRVGIDPVRDSSFWNELHDHWNYWFFHNEHLKDDRPLPGAVDYVKALMREGAHVMYLTGRDVCRMQKGTEASLAQWGFPVHAEAGAAPESVVVKLKPDACMVDEKFKLDILRHLTTAYDTIVFFENEPVNLNIVAKNLPHVQLVFIDTVHSGREDILPGINRVPHFEISEADFAAFKP